MKKIALVTDNHHQTISKSDKHLLRPLSNMGFGVDVLSWQNKDVVWEDYDTVILRSCWNYHKFIDSFRNWIEKLEQTGVNVWNRPSVIWWNLDKQYLSDLSIHGVLTPKTILIEGGQAVNIPEILKQLGWQEAILKPCIGASAYNIEHIDLNSSGYTQSRIDEKLAPSSKKWLLQEFMPEIDKGEWSFIFFQGEFSHAVIKIPKAGSIFVQSRFGSRPALFQPCEDHLLQAKEILAHASNCMKTRTSDLLYARLDAIPRNGTLYLMELELMEPGLFLDLAGDQAVELFAQAIVKTI